MNIYLLMLVATIAIAISFGRYRAKSTMPVRHLVLDFFLLGVAGAIYAGICAIASDAWSGHSERWPAVLTIIGTIFLFFSIFIVPIIAGLMGGYLLALVLRMTGRMNPESKMG